MKNTLGEAPRPNRCWSPGLSGCGGAELDARHGESDLLHQVFRWGFESGKVLVIDQSSMDGIRKLLRSSQIIRIILEPEVVDLLLKELMFTGFILQSQAAKQRNRHESTFQ